MPVLSIDIETYSSTDLLKSGVYKYVEDPDFEILLCSYAYDDGPIITVDLPSGELPPNNFITDVLDPEVQKSAANANFERVCLSAYFLTHGCATREQLQKLAGKSLLVVKGDYPKYISPVNWYCSLVHARSLSLPGNLAGAAAVLGVTEQKGTEGKTLIRYFCKPCKPTKVNGGRTRNLPKHDAEKWASFVEYNRQDVRAEREVRTKLHKFPLLPWEQDLFYLDQEINDRGVRVHLPLVKKAVELYDEFIIIKKALFTEMTGVENPNSGQQVKAWIKEETGLEIKSLDKKEMPALKALLKETDNSEVLDALRLRGALIKSSVAKYNTMVKTCCSDHRIRGLVQFYGAERTGRWAGRLVQMQNLPQNTDPGFDSARWMIAAEKYSLLKMLWPNIAGILSQLIRTMFVSSGGDHLVVSDFSAIEARVIAWLAGEQWRLDVFNTHGKIYEASAASMFKVPIESIGKDSIYRKKGKVAELACGYQGGVGALKSMGGEKMGLSEPEMKNIIKTWRLENPNIVKLWADVEAAAMRAVDSKLPVKHKGLVFQLSRGILFIELPSGRKLAYPKIHIAPHRKFRGKSELMYYGRETGGWGMISTYGGKLVENIVQAIARDCLAVAMVRVNAAGHKIIMHVHDEIIIEAPISVGVDEINELMSKPISWAKGLPLDADGFESSYYKKG